MATTACQVTLVMPLYNTMSRVDSCGTPLVNRMMDSISNQLAGSPRVLVLDNRSADESVKHISGSAPSNVPLTVEVDSQQRPAEEAIFLLMQQVETPYVGIVNDDDALAPTFISELLAAARQSNAALTYPNARWLGLDGTTTGTLVPYRGRAYGDFRSGPSNLRRYLRVRNPVPMIFGLWRTPDAQQVFDVHRFDEHSHDLDNMILARTLARGLPVKFVNRHLLFYSVRQGHKSPPVTPDVLDSDLTPLDLLISNWTHHVRFSRELLTRTIQDTSPRPPQESSATALVISQELRARLSRAVTWALGLAFATEEQFAASLRLRRAIGHDLLDWRQVRLGRQFGRQPSHHLIRGAFAVEQGHWLALLDLLCDQEQEEMPVERTLPLVEDVRILIGLLARFAA